MYLVILNFAKSGEIRYVLLDLQKIAYKIRRWLNIPVNDLSYKGVNDG